MSTQPNAPDADALEDDGRTLIYEGHNAPLSVVINGEEIDQSSERQVDEKRLIL